VPVATAARKTPAAFPSIPGKRGIGKEIDYYEAMPGNSWGLGGSEKDSRQTLLK